MAYSPPPFTYKDYIFLRHEWVTSVLCEMQLLINALTSMAVEVKAWMSNYTPLFYMNVIIHLRPDIMLV